jgi:peptide deformylase
MMLLHEYKLVTYPNPILAKSTLPFTSNDAEYRKNLFDHMSRIMIDNLGVGLAANQIGISESVLVMRVNGENVMMINPLLSSAENTICSNYEGCLSIPGLRLLIKRAILIEVMFEDIDGRNQTLSLSGMTARIFQHEFDHLNGILITDRVSRLRLQIAKKKQAKKIKYKE